MIGKSPRGAAYLRTILASVWMDTTTFVRLRIALVLVTVISASVATALSPVALQQLIDGFSKYPQVSAPGVTLVGLYVLSQWLARVLNDIRGLLFSRVERRMYRNLSARMFSHVMRLPLRYHLDRHTGAIGQTLQNGLQGYQMVLSVLVFTLLPVTIELGTVITVLSGLRQPVFLALFGTAVACYAVAFSYTTRAVMDPARSASAAQIDASASMTDSILNYETVKYFTAEAAIQEKVGRALQRTEDATVRFARRLAWNGIGIGTLFAGLLTLTLLYAAQQVSLGHMTVGTFVLINTYVLQIARPIEMLGGAVQSLSQGLALLEKMLDIFRERTEPESRTGSALDSYPGRLDFQNVRLAYRPERPILKDISFKLPPGKTLAVVGTSGAGKSTLVRLLVRLIEPDGGRILLDSLPISQLPLEVLRRSIAVVPQDTVLFNDTIAYNIAFGKPGATRSEIERAARLAHLHDFVTSLPEGYDTPVGERGVKLSGGEKQRVSIARAAIKAPRIYVFDEATSSLDSKTEREILRNLHEISRHSTTLVIAHRLSTVVHADEIAVLENGTISERGSHAALLRLNGRYAALWEAQQSAARQLADVR